MTTEQNESTPKQQRLAAVLAAYLESVDAGGAVEQREWLQRYPEFAEELARFFAGREQINHITAPLRFAAPTVVLSSTERCLGDFRILREIGRGGMGVVYEAEQLSLHRRVALKVLPFATVLDEKSLKRFKNEAIAAASLDHPNIVSVHSVGCERGVHYYAMELIEGQSLAHVIDGQRTGDQPPVASAPQNSVDTQTLAALSTQRSHRDREDYRSVARLGIQIAAALEYAHEQGIVHRDIKPSNLILDQKGRVWISDFGLAQIQGEHNLTMTGDMLGTLRYMSPEQAEGKKLLDLRTDIYSLGVTLYELLALRPPFEIENRQQLLRQVLERQPPSLRKLDRSIPADFETIVLKAMAKRPESRYDSAQALADDLRRFLEHKPIKARRITRWQVVRHLAQRNPVLTALVVTIASLLVFIAVAGLLIAQRQSAQAESYRSLLYVSDINSAYKAWDDGNLERVRLLLSRHRPDVGQEDLRGFEWHHLWTQLNLTLTAPRLMHDRHVSGVAFSADGEILASAGPDGVRLWELHGLQSKSMTALGGPDVTSVAISSDGQQLATGSRDHTVTLWDLATGERVAQFAGHNAGIVKVCFSPSGHTLASASSDGVVKLWDTESGEEGPTLDGHAHEVSGLSFSPDGQMLATGSFDHTVRLWEVETGKSLRTLVHGHRVYAVAFSPDGNALAGGGYNYQVTVWETHDWQERDRIRSKGHSVSCLAFSPDGKILATGARDKTVKFWNILRGEEIATLKGHTDDVTSVAFSPDGRVLASGSNDGSVRLWETADFVSSPSTTQRGSWATPIAFSPDGRVVVAGKAIYEDERPTEPGGLRWFELATGHKTVPARLESFVRAVAFSANGQWLVTGGYDKGLNGEVKLWDASTLSRLSDFEAQLGLNWSDGQVYSVAISPDGTLLAVAGGIRTVSGHLRMWDLVQGDEKPPWGVFADIVISMAFSPDGKTLATVEFNNRVPTLKLWDLEGTPPQAVAVVSESEGAFCASFSPDGRILAFGSWSGDITLLDTETLEPRHVLRGHSDAVLTLAFTADNRTLASGGSDGTVRLWHVATGAELTSLKARYGTTSVAFSPDGKTLASGLADASVMLWHATTEKQEFPATLY